MRKTSPDALRRSDRILVGALTIVLAVVSGAVGAAAAYRPYTEQRQVPAPAAAAEAPLRPSAEEVQAAASEEQAVASKLASENKCLAEAIYYEARGDSEDGKKAIAEVIFARLKTGLYGRTICEVVHQGAGRPHCQFSFTCNGVMRYARIPSQWAASQRLAARILTGESPLTNLTGGATYFHADTIDPGWPPYLVRTRQVGHHIFYRNTARWGTM